MQSSPDIGEIILNELNRRNRSLPWLTEEVGISVKSLHRYIEDPDKIRVKHLKSICNILEVDLFYCYSATLAVDFFPKITPPRKTNLSK